MIDKGRRWAGSEARATGRAECPDLGLARLAAGMLGEVAICRAENRATCGWRGSRVAGSGMLAGRAAVRIEPVPTRDCDHRHESHGYEPNDTLRHLVQVRDYTCTFPPCSRHARDSDFEHGAP